MQEQVIMPVLSKLRPFESNTHLLACFRTAASTINPISAVREGKILLVRTGAAVLSAGILELYRQPVSEPGPAGDLRTGRVCPRGRTPVTVIVDESQSFTGIDYGAALAQLAKFGGNLILTTQGAGFIGRSTASDETDDPQASPRSCRTSTPCWSTAFPARTPCAWRDRIRGRAQPRRSDLPARPPGLRALQEGRAAGRSFPGADGPASANPAKANRGRLICSTSWMGSTTVCRTRRRRRRIGNGTMKDRPLDPTQQAVGRFLFDNPWCSAALIGRFLGLGRSSLGRLSDRALFERIQVPEPGGRGYQALYALTAEGSRRVMNAYRSPRVLAEALLLTYGRLGRSREALSGLAGQGRLAWLLSPWRPSRRAPYFDALFALKIRDQKAALVALASPPEPVKLDWYLDLIAAWNRWSRGERAAPAVLVLLGAFR
jgi:hypothetical protein